MLSPAAWWQELLKNVYFSCRWSWAIGRKAKVSFKTTFFEDFECLSTAKTCFFCFAALKTGSDWIEENDSVYDIFAFISDKHCKDACKYFKFSNISIFKECPETCVNSEALVTIEFYNKEHRKFLEEMQKCWKTHKFGTQNCTWTWEEQSLANL